MAPTSKRKRPDRTSSIDAGENRPSPHRPANTALGQHDLREGGNRRSSRGNQGGRGGRRNDRGGDKNPNNLAISGRGTPTQGPMSPPPPRPSSASQLPPPTFDLSAPVLKLDPSLYDYCFITDERKAAWNSTGRQEVVAAAVQARLDEDTLDLASVFQELIRATLDGRTDPADAGNCIKEILGPDTAAEEPHFDAPTFFLDIFSMICETEETSNNPSLRTFALASGVSQLLMRQKLDGQVLINLGLTRDTFIRQGIRQTTNLLYRQSNYNLLREESEGYSKLCTELFTTSASETPTSDNVEAAFERVRGLIGTFDLDVGRVLDITLDVFAAVLIKNFRFFVKMLRLSSWWPRNLDLNGALPDRSEILPSWALPSSFNPTPTEEDEAKAAESRKKRDTLFWERARDVGLDAYFELGGRDAVDEETRKRIFGDKEIIDSELDADHQWINATGTLPPSGNRVAAQLLGFKLRFYASNARDKEDELPQNLLYLAALLIKIGFISLRDIYEHIWPLDEAMAGVREIKLKELEEKERLTRPGGATNALMSAGALPDDTLPNNGRTRETAGAKTDAAKVTSETDDKEKLGEPLDQKIGLLIQLLTIGALPESLFILGRFPWIPEISVEVHDLINRIILYSIKDVYDTCSPVPVAPQECPTRLVADYDQGGVPKGQVRVSHLPVRKLLRWPFADKFDHNDASSYRFYWDEWADNVPVCQSVDDIFTLCGTFLNCSGVRIGTDSALMSKLARIGNVSLVQDPSPHNMARWQDLLKRLLVPALSFTKSNTGIVNEIFDMLRHYPVSVRYSIYAEWFEGQTSRLPALRTAFARTVTETQGIMKRISMTNITTMARSLAKAAYASPGIVFRVALGQIEEYTNLTEVVVECAKYFTELGYDVLLWSLMSSLGGKNRVRTSSEFALLPSQWLLALSRFAGKIFKRYSIMSPSPILQYVNNQLHEGNSKDLVILKELIAQMSGIVPNTDFTDAQLSGMTGWDNLRRITLIGLQDRRYDSTKTSRRFIKALTDTRLAGELLISIAQYRQAAIYSIPDDEAHIKVLASMIDDTQSIFFQYLDLLRSNFSVEDFDKHVPGIPDLLTDFGLQPALAFMIGRSSVLSMIAQVTSPALNGTTNAASTSDVPTLKSIDADGDIAMDSEDKPKKDDNEEIVPKEGANGESSAVQLLVKERSPSIPGESVLQPLDKFQQCLEPIMSTVETLYPDDSWVSLTPEFYVTFWITTLSEIAVPKASYEAAFQRLLAQESELSKPDRTDTTRQGVARRAEAKKVVTESKAAILREWNQHMEYAQKLKLRLSKRKHSWFKQAVKADALSDDILEKCIFPRLLLSPTDADFSFSMIKFMHETNTPHFRTLSLYVRLFKTHRLRSIIFTCTVREAENLGRFLRLVLLDLARWHAKSAVYEKEALGSSKQTLIGFAKALDSDGKPKGFLEHDGKNGFRNILLNWHKNLNSALRDCLDGKEWMHIRNAITVLKSVVEVFPAVDFMGNNFIKQLETLAKREKGVREDLALTGNAVLVGLKKRSKSWVMVQAFGFSMVPPGKPNVNGSNTPSSTANSTPKMALKATAPEFKPRPTSSSDSKHNTTEVEDGEVDDAKNPTAATKSKQISNTEQEISVPVEVLTPQPPKSDILLRREQILREREAAKAAASPQSSHLAGPARPDSSRHLPTSASGDRSNHSLPSRPDIPFPAHQDMRNPRHGDRRDGREPRLSDSNRSGRPVDRPGERPGDRVAEVSRAGPGERPVDRVNDRPRDFSGSDRRSLDSNPKDFTRPLDRMPGSDRLRDPPPRWTPDSARESQDRFGNGIRGHESSGRLSRETAMPPPRSLPSASDRAAPITSERPPPVNPERQELINPERQALISSGKNSPRGESPRRGREDLKDRSSSRAQSPRRHTFDNEKDLVEGRRDDRPSRNGPEDHHHPSRPRLEESHPPPAGPRSDRQMDRPIDRIPAERMIFQPMPNTSRALDPDHGRLNPPPRQSQPDPNFGRLNPAPVSDIPSGPRDRGSRGNRPAPPPAVPPRRDGWPDIQRPPSPDKQPPTGPSQNRAPRRAVGQIDTYSTSPSIPTTSAATSPAIGVHPDRAKHLPVHAVAQVPLPPPPTTPANVPVAAGMHPERRMAYGNDVSMNQQGNNRARQQVPPVVTTGPPSGPKASQASPISAVANNMSAPTGPASSSERTQRGGPRRQLAGINTTLQQGASGSINVRGRGGRVNNGGRLDSPIQGQSHFVPPPPPGLPPNSNSQPEPVREIKDLINPARADLITANPASGDDRDRESRNRRSDHSGRRSRKSSRSRERESKRPKTDEERPARENKDRRGGDRTEPERERNPGRSSPHPDLIVGREPRVPTRDSNRDRDRERSERDLGRSRDGRERESRDSQHEAWNVTEHRPERGERGPERGGRSRDMGRGGDPRNDERRDSRSNRGGEDSGRKRHSEDAAGMDNRGREKRPRRG